MNRSIDPTIINYFKTRKSYSYAHLIKFERAIIAPQELDISEKQFVYLTDGSVDLYFNDPRVDSSPTNLATKYRANKILDIPEISEYSTARATALDLKMDGSAIGAYLADDVTVTSAGTDKWNLDFSFSVIGKGFAEGDKISVEILGTAYKVLISNFPLETRIVVSKLEVNLPLGTQTTYIELVSEELVSILQDKTSEDYASFINRKVYIYKVFFDENNVRIGDPYYCYKGIIQSVSIDDDGGALTVNWTLNSHWGDFSEVKGRITSDEAHRALDEYGFPQPNSAIKPIYAYDKGFIHADTAIHLEANYTVQVEKQDVKYKKGFFGIGAKVKVKKYFAPEDRQTELDFQLQGKTLDVIYGVRPAEGSPIFADTKNDNSSEVYVVYAICEGEIAGLYDLIIQDNSLICNNKADADARMTQTSENNVEVVCYGRADRGDVLEGVQSTSTSTIDYFNIDNFLDYWNDQSVTYLTQFNGFTQPLGASSGTVGVLHENSIKLNEPIDMTLSVYTGRTNQRAAPDLVQIAQSNNFKIQNDYWTGSDSMEYWGPNHRLLDTAYLSGHFTISEGETSIPTLKMVVKGTFVNCYNYDNSYQAYDKATGESEANFLLGDLVDIYNSSNVLLDTGLRIINKFSIRNSAGQLETRFQLSATPSLGYVNGVPSTTKFYMKKGVNNWTMVTYNYQELAGTVNTFLEDVIQSTTTNVANDTVVVVLPPSSDVSTFGSGITDISGFEFLPALRFMESF